MSSPSSLNLCYFVKAFHYSWTPEAPSWSLRVLWAPTLKATGLQDG